jgi:hypothetical protein
MQETKANRAGTDWGLVHVQNIEVKDLPIALVTSTQVMSMKIQPSTRQSGSMKQNDGRKLCMMKRVCTHGTHSERLPDTRTPAEKGKEEQRENNLVRDPLLPVLSWQTIDFPSPFCLSCLFD